MLYVFLQEGTKFADKPARYHNHENKVFFPFIPAVHFPERVYTKPRHQNNICFDVP